MNFAARRRFSACRVFIICNPFVKPKTYSSFRAKLRGAKNLKQMFRYARHDVSGGVEKKLTFPLGFQSRKTGVNLLVGLYHMTEVAAETVLV